MSGYSLKICGKVVSELHSRNELDISKLDLEELNGLNAEEVHLILTKERDVFLHNLEIVDEFKREFEKSQHKYIDFLKQYLNNDSSGLEIYSALDRSIIYTSKLTANLISEPEDEFFDTLRPLYITGFIENSHPFDVEDFLNDNLGDSFDRPPTVTIRTERNLLWLYRHHPDQFAPSLLAPEDGYSHAILSSGIDTAEKAYEAFHRFGTVSNLVCANQSMTGITPEGLQLVLAESIRENESLVKELKSQIEDLDGAKKDAEKQIQKITKMNKNHSKKIQNFYKDIGTILSILVAAFSVIGINLSAIPKITGSFMVNIISLNLSVLLCVSFMFYGLQRLVFDFGDSPKKAYRGWYVLIGIFVTLLVVTFIFGRAQYHVQLASLNQTQTSLHGLQKQITQEKQQNESLQREYNLLQQRFNNVDAAKQK